MPDRRLLLRACVPANTDFAWSQEPSASAAARLDQPQTHSGWPSRPTSIGETKTGMVKLRGRSPRDSWLVGPTGLVASAF